MNFEMNAFSDDGKRKISDKLKGSKTKKKKKW